MNLSFHNLVHMRIVQQTSELEENLTISLIVKIVIYYVFPDHIRIGNSKNSKQKQHAYNFLRLRKIRPPEEKLLFHTFSFKKTAVCQPSIDVNTKKARAWIM